MEHPWDRQRHAWPSPSLRLPWSQLPLPLTLSLTQVHGVAGERPALNIGRALSWLFRGAGMNIEQQGGHHKNPYLSL
jgi:hypothetical protein